MADESADAAKPAPTSFEYPLFVTETELARRLGFGDETWRKVRPVLEQRGLPRRDPLMGNKRYWPAVRRFFDLRAGLKNIAADMHNDAEYHGFR